MLTNVNAVNIPPLGWSRPGVVPRRERVRAATEAEILTTARALLVEGGIESVSLREVGRRMGMTASAIYRYYDGLAVLLDALEASLFDELAAVVASSGRELNEAHSRTERTLADLMTASRAFRTWALGHPREFGLMFGPRHPGWTEAGCVRAAAAGERFGQVFAGMFATGFTISKEHDGTLFGGLPHPLNEMFAGAWLRLLGAVSVEVFGHMVYMTDDSNHLFEVEMSDCAMRIAIGLADAGSGPVPSKAVIAALASAD